MWVDCYHLDVTFRVGWRWLVSLGYNPRGWLDVVVTTWVRPLGLVGCGRDHLKVTLGVGLGWSVSLGYDPGGWLDVVVTTFCDSWGRLYMVVTISRGPWGWVEVVVTTWKQLGKVT